MCEYAAPCLTVLTEGTGLNYEYRGPYKLLREDPNELMTLADSEMFFRRSNRSMTTSMRPVYYRPAGEGQANETAGEVDDTTAVLFHTGTKWAMAKINLVA